MLKLSVVAVAGLLAVGAGAEAGTVNHRELEQRQRIQEGIRSGELTRLEAARLTAQQAHIRREEWRYRHVDGHLGVAERLDLQRDLNRASRAIYAQKHDGQDR
jgi:hypothetical protein